MTTKLSGDYVLPAGQILSSANEDAIWIEGTAWSSLTLNGRVEVTNATYQYPVAAVRASMDGLNAALRTVTIGSTGSISVTSTLPGGYAFAISTGGAFGQGIKVVNLGSIEVRTAGEASGLGIGSGGLENRGSIIVSAPGSVTGLTIETGGPVINSGTIAVTGGSGAYQGALGVLYRGVDAHTFTNSGVIRVASLSSTVIATGLSVSGYTNLVNTGLIEAKTAIYLVRDGILSGNGRHTDIVNSGVLRGDVFLNNTAAEPVRLRNPGVIEGAVTLNTGADTYNGVGGTVSGGVHGEAGADSLIGGSGSETLSGDAGNDTIDGGAGGFDVLDGGEGIDALSFAGAATGVVLNISAPSLPGLTLSGFEQYIGSGHADRIAGSAAADTLEGGAGNDTVYGGASDDIITDQSGANYLRGDEGNDRIAGGADFDDINGNMGSDTASGGLGDDWVVGGKDNDNLAGDGGGDLVYGNIGADTCDGGEGNDIVRGGQEDDVVKGGAGGDFVSGDKGSDTMTGGLGADIFHTFGDAGIDRVTDFSLAEGDRVQLDPGTQYTVAQVGADTVISMTGGGQMTLVGVQMSSLTPGWIFGA